MSSPCGPDDRYDVDCDRAGCSAPRCTHLIERPREAFLESDGPKRRTRNQAVFARIEVGPDGPDHRRLSPPDLRRHGRLEARTELSVTAGRPQPHAVDGVRPSSRPVHLVKSLRVRESCLSWGAHLGGTGHRDAEAFHPDPGPAHSLADSAAASRDRSVDGEPRPTHRLLHLGPRPAPCA